MDYLERLTLKISVVTSTFNCVNELDKTIKSMRGNASLDFEWIIVDGESTDGTVELIESNIDIVDKFISEEDTGIYDAWNKAVQYITGDWIIFLGAGDAFVDGSLSKIDRYLGGISSKENKLAYCNVRLVNKLGETLTTYKEIKPNDWANGRPSLPCHQGVFQHKSLFTREKIFDDSYRIAADSKFLFESMKITQIKYFDLDLSKMEMYGVSTNPAHILKVKSELERLRLELGLKMPLLEYLKFTFSCYVKHFIVNYLGVRFFSFLSKIVSRIKSKENLY